MRRQIIGLCLDCFLQNRKRLLALVLDDEEPSLQQRRLGRRVWLREDVIDDFLRLLNVSIRGSQRGNTQQRRGKVSLGGKRRIECRFRLLGFAERAQRVADGRLKRRLSIGTAEIRAAEFRDELLRVPVVDQGASKRRQRLLRRIAKLQRHAQLLDRAGRIATLDQNGPQEVTRFSIVRRFLESIPELDHRSAGIALGKIVPGRLDQRFGRIPTAGHEQRTESGDHAKFDQNVPHRLLHCRVTFVDLDVHRPPQASLEAEAMDQLVQRGPADAEEIGRLAEVTIDSAEGAENGLFLCFVAHLAQVELHCFLILDSRRDADICGADPLSIGHDHGPLDDIFEFAHVPRPGVGFDRSNRIWKQRHRTAPLLAAETVHEAVGQKCGVSLARA